MGVPHLRVPTPRPSVGLTLDAARRWNGHISLPNFLWGDVVLPRRVGVRGEKAMRLFSFFCILVRVTSGSSCLSKHCIAIPSYREVTWAGEATCAEAGLQNCRPAAFWPRKFCVWASSNKVALAAGAARRWLAPRLRACQPNRDKGRMLSSLDIDDEQGLLHSLGRGARSEHVCTSMLSFQKRDGGQWWRQIDRRFQRSRCARPTMILGLHGFEEGFRARDPGHAEA